MLPKANIRVDTNLVLIPVTVTDPLNRFVTGLEKENFKILEDKHGTDHLAVFERGRAHFGGGGFRLQRQHGAEAGKIAPGGSPVLQDRQSGGRVLPGAVQRSADLVQPFTHNLEDIQNRLTFTQSKGRTALLDAIYLGLHEMKKAHNPRKALLVISDGGDNNSRYTEREIKNLVKEADVQIYAIGIYEPCANRGRTPEEAAGQGLLTEIAEPDRRTAVSRGQHERVAGYRR